MSRLPRALRIAAAGLAAIAVAAAGCGQGEDTPPAPKPEPTAKLAKTDPGQIEHKYVLGADFIRGAEVLAARQVAKQEARANAKARAKAKAAAVPKPTAAQLEPGPGGIPPASAGTNGSFKPHSSGELKRIDANSASSIAGTDPDHSAILVGRTALAPPGAPAQVKSAISAANAIVGRPYVWGGGHGSWNSRGYDCSGSVSYALGGAGLLDAPLTSGGLESWGAPGPGKWITVYANGGHTYAVIAGLRWDTVGNLRGSGPRWHAELPYKSGFVVRHPPGL